MVDDDAPVAPSSEEAAPEEGSCVMPDARGVWRPCDEVLAERAPARSPTVEDERPPLPLPAPPEEERPKVRAISTTRPASGAYGRLVADTQDAVKEEFPLLTLRERVKALADEADVLLDDPIRYREAPAKRQEHERLQTVLERVEKVAFHKMRSCIATEMPEWSETYTPPSLYRMTPGGLVRASPDERRKLPSFDPPGCERIRLVDEALIEKVRRVVEIEDTLENGRLGYYERDQRAALEREREALLHDLGEGGPAPLPKVFDR